MSYTIRPASRSEAKPLIGIYAESGCGKTWSSLMLARGFVGPKGRIGMIETESGRGEAYSDILPGGYDVISMRGDFSPTNYGEALSCAEAANLDALIIDSASHEWEGAGGVLSMAAQNQANGKKGPLVWQMPKLDHQRHFMLRLMGTPIPLVIVCMRAKFPMEEKAVNGKKEWVKSDVLQPKQSEDILFEMFVHGWIDRDHRFHGTKYTRPDLREVIVDGEPISIATGENLAAWARGAKTPAQTLLLNEGEARALSGMDALKGWFETLKPAQKKLVVSEMDRLKQIAMKNTTSITVDVADCGCPDFLAGIHELGCRAASSSERGGEGGRS